MPPSLMLTRAIGAPIAAGALLGLAVFAIDTYVPLYVQGGLGGSVKQAAMTVTPVMLAWASSSFVAAPLVIKVGFKRAAIVGACITAIGLVGLLLCEIYSAPIGVLTATLFVCGCGFGPASMSYLLSAQESVKYQQRGIVTSAVTYFRTMGGAMGVGLLGAVFNFFATPGLAYLKSRGITPAKLMDPHQLKEIPPELLHPAQGAIIHALLWVFTAMLVLSLVQVTLSSLIPARKASHKPTPAEAMESMAA
jgi:MFS family permease